MGFFGPKTVAQVSIDFYNDLEATVFYECINPADNDDKDTKLVYLVAFYYSKMLYNLGNHKGAEALIVYIQGIYDGWKKSFQKNPHQEYRPTLPEHYVYLVDKREDKTIKSFKAELKESGRGTYSIWTGIPTLEPNRYIPSSVVALIQYALKNLHEPTQTIFLVMTLGAMNHYYKEQGNHTAMKQIMEAPHYGIQTAIELLKGLSR